MADQRIIYSDDSGQVVVLIPTDEALSTHSITEIAEKDVPSGKSYKIVSVSDISEDRSFRDAWEVDTSLLTDGVGSEHDMFITDPLHPDYVAPEVE